MRVERTPGRALRVTGLACLAVALGTALVGLLDRPAPEGSWRSDPLATSWILAWIGGLGICGAALFYAGARRRRVDPKGFLSATDEHRVVAAIRAFEARTSGEIRVHISHRGGEDVLAAARRLFERLRMSETAERNGVLFVVGAVDRRLAVVGDEGIHRSVGASFWSDVIRRVEARFREDAFVEGLEEGIRLAGDALVAHFPRRPDDINELPDGLSRD
jgi:uncharacterized membrane protein